MDGFEYHSTFKNAELCEKWFNYKKDLCELDEYYVKIIKKKFHDTIEVIYWQF